MADDNVLFVRENGNVANEDNEDVWDDSALIDAYDKAVNLAKKEVIKRMDMEVNKPYKKWAVTASCRAVYTGDGKLYEAVITKIFENSDSCIVRFIGYGNEQKVKLSSLQESEGFQKQIEQMKNSNGMTFSANSNPKKYNGENMDCESEETKTYKHHVMPGPSFNSTADIMPPAPPLPPQMMAKLPDNDADALSSMLMSWYISGFHTGYYHGLKQANNNQQKRKNC